MALRKRSQIPRGLPGRFCLASRKKHVYASEQQPDSHCRSLSFDQDATHRCGRHFVFTLRGSQQCKSGLSRMAAIAGLAVVLLR